MNLLSNLELKCIFIVKELNRKYSTMKYNVKFVQRKIMSKTLFFNKIYIILIT